MGPLQAIKKIIVHDAIMESVMGHIKANNMAVGDRIPAERALAEALKVSRSSVRGALKALESHGVLEIRHGDGAYLRSLSASIYYQYSSDHKENLELLRNLVQARQAIEEWAVAEAAAIITPAQVKELYASEKRQLRAFERKEPQEKPEFELPNMALELAVTRLIGNPILLEMHEKIEKMWKQCYKHLEMTPFSPQIRYEHHIAIIKGLENGDAEQAKHAIGHHNRSLEQHINAAIATLDAANAQKE